MKPNRILIAAIAAAALAFTVAPAAAQEVDTTGLSETQIAELQRQAAVAREEQGVTPATAAQTVNEWVEVGEGIGSGLAAAARETGTVVNEFAQTPVGQLTVAVIVFKVIGGDLIQLVVGLLWYAVLIPIWFYFAREAYAPKVELTYNEAGKKASKIVTPLHVTGDVIAGRFIGWVALGVILIGGSFTMFA